MPRPGVGDARPPSEAVGRLQADAADPAFTDLLGNFGGYEHLGAVDDEGDLQGCVDRQGVGWDDAQ